MTTPRATTVNLIVNSLARTTAAVIDLLVDTTDRDVESVHLVGGGVRMPLFIDRLRDHLSAPVIVGAAESAALGNAMIQGIALGLWADVADARKSL